MDAKRDALEREIAEMQYQAAQLSDSDDWAEQCEQALLATAILLHRDMLSDAALRSPSQHS